MSNHVPLNGLIKIESESNTLIQSYINTFNKEIEKNDPSLQDIHEDENPLQDMEANNGLETAVVETIQITDLEHGVEIIADDESANTSFFLGEQGHYYFHTDSQPVITSVGEAITPDNEILLTEETMIESNDTFQTVTIVPSESGEVSYVLIVQPEDKGPDENTVMKMENDMNVYEFKDNEDLDNLNDNMEVMDEDRAKVLSPKKQHPMTKPHMCSYCSYNTSKKYLLSRHMKSHSEERPHKCSVCSRGFKTLASLQNHVNTHTGIKPHKCRFCKSAFTTSGELVRHVRYRHTHEKPHKCNECEYASVELSKLKRHARCHTGERPYQCPHCTYASPDTFKLKRHLRTHTGEKPYECDNCHMCFTQSNSLKAHKLTHNIGDKPIFHCELCPTTCGRKTDLRIHVQKLHTSDKPLKCKRCGKSFPDRYNFKLHTKTHEGEKCFKCEMCPYASTSLRHLSSHLLVHTDEKPFSCEKCEQTFRHKQLLKRHQNLYHNPNYIPPLPKEKSHECLECGKPFRHKGNLIRHMAIHDPESAIHEKNLALKIGRQRKVQLLDPQLLQNGQHDEYEGETATDTEVDVSSENMPHYVVFEVIHVPEENSNEPITFVSSKPYVDDEFEEDEDSDRSHSKQGESTNGKQTNTEKDVENCFGFDVDEAEDDLNDDKINLYGMKFLRE
ncbi:uncharacterized protein LOC143922940 isoform X2 [Arctopsyche grandis]|uniref:uncharacterized protein LOC143922940 isoform X2 n=1 Tax=Arctopsyche grandis TaxID=121162 RepID=UPI00406D869C